MATATPTSWSASSIATTVPAGAATGNVVVTVGGVPSPGVWFRLAPTITNVSPTVGRVGTPLSITGAHWGATQGSSIVEFRAGNVGGYIFGSPTAWSDTSITVPVRDGALSGNMFVEVDSVASNHVRVTVGPTISSIAPVSGPVGTAVT